MANLQIVISALDKASGDINKIKSEISGVNNASKSATKGTGDFTTSITSMIGKAALAAGAVAAVGAALKGVYDSAKEAAELDYARSKFDNLSESIGTVSDALLIDLRAATSGMVSDADLIAGAGDFMALGLAKTHDEVVRLSTVAGALNMNMNQLVLTLTNQTTMRFDQLGVSVDGFDEKVKALEKSGMSASEAFTEAFLQQAEEQITKVGNAADSSIGAFQRMEAAQANYFNALKQDLAEAGTWWAQYWENFYNERLSEDAFNSLNEHAQALGIDTKATEMAIRSADAYGRITAEGIDQNKAAVEALGEQVKYQEQMNAMRSRGTNANYDYAASERLVADSIAYVRSEFQQQADNITTIDSTYKGIIDLGYKYSDALAEINAKQAEYDAMPGWKKASKDGKELLADIEALKGSMKDLANQVTLDMFQATIAIGGVTESELSAYMQMAIDMGLMSEEGAQAALEAYGSAIKTINGYELDEKTGNITFDAQQAFDIITMINAMEIADKNGNINLFVKYYGTTGGNEDEQLPGGATGMPVSAGKPYLWQEYGYRGEKFVPAQNGYVLSRSDASRAVANAAPQPAVYSGPSAQDIALAVRDAILMAGWR